MTLELTPDVVFRPRIWSWHMSPQQHKQKSDSRHRVHTRGMAPAHLWGVCVHTHTSSHTAQLQSVWTVFSSSTSQNVLAVLVLLTDCGTDSHAQGINPSRRSALNKGTCISQQAQRGFTGLYSAVHSAGYMWYLSQMITKTNDQIRRKLSSRK